MRAGGWAPRLPLGCMLRALHTPLGAAWNLPSWPNASPTAVGTECQRQS